MAFPQAHRQGSCMQNPMRARRLAVASSFALLLATAAPLPVSAADGTWVPTAAGTYSWDTPGNWSLNTVADGAGFTSTFGSGATGTQTITLDNSHFIGNLAFSVHGWKIQGPGTLTLSSGITPTISVAGPGATIDAVIAGTQGFTSTGLLTLGGNNSYTGLTTVSTGTVILNHNNALGGTADGTSVTSGAQVTVSNGITVTGETITLAGGGNGGVNGALVANGTAEWAGGVRLNGTSTRIGTLNNTSLLTISGVIANGTGSNLYISGFGTTVLSGDNTYTGLTHIYRGTLKLDAGNNRLPTGTALTLGGTADNSTFDLNGWSQTVASIETGTNTSTRTVTNSSATTSTLTVNQTTGTKTFDGVVSGKINLIKSGAGILNLTGTTNTFSGNITVNGGTLGIANAFISNTADVSIASGAIFALSFSGTDTIGTLTLAGIAQQTGTYGALGSGAQFESSFFSGTGLLNVSTFAIPEPSTFAALAGLATAAFAIRRRRSA